MRSIDEVFLAVQIETKTAVENAEAILSTPGVDGCWVGPSDLALSYGIHPRDRFNSEVHAEAVEKILQACKNTGNSPDTRPLAQRRRWRWRHADISS